MTEGDAGAAEQPGDGAAEIDAVLARLAESRSSEIVHVADVDGVAVELADRIDGELVDGHDGFVDGLDTRLEQLAARASARAALDRHAEMEGADEATHRLTDVGALRSLVRRIEQSSTLVDASRDKFVERASSAADIAVHPDSIRAAAADLVTARSQLAEVHADLDGEAGEAGEHEDDGPATADLGDDADDFDRGDRSLADRARAPLGRSVAVFALALVLAVFVLVTTGAVVALVLPGCALVWVSVVLVRRRDGVIDERKASQNLARVAAFTDEAYGGGVVAEPDSLDPDGRVQAAEDRLRYAEKRWTDLVGPDADVDDLDRVLQAHDPRFGIDDDVVDAAPTVRAAQAHQRRLLAQWKLAWWALDRVVPSMEEATAAIDGLAAEGIDAIVVPTHAARLAAGRSSFDDLAAGRSLDELRLDAEAQWPVLVVADADGAVDESEFSAGTARLSEDVRVVLVAPGPGVPGGA